MVSVNKQNKVLFYLKGYSQKFLPSKQAEETILKLYKGLSATEKEEVEFRVDYYNKLSLPFSGEKIETTVADLLKPKTPKAYYFDAYAYARYFEGGLPLRYVFGDVTEILESPSICKSRPIFGDNENNVLLNLDKARHFLKVKNDQKFSKKKDVLIGRGNVFQDHRREFYERNFQSKFCDLGQVNKIGGNTAWIKPKLTLSAHLHYKFILSLEGNDVATNLKWIMSSNSVAVSPPLKMETWYMEGTLVPDEHFICIPGLDHLEDKLQYYIDHPKEAEEIAENAQQYRAKFENKNLEKLISLMVLKKYFSLMK